jgi:hypothetical protein
MYTAKPHKHPSSTNSLWTVPTDTGMSQKEMGKQQPASNIVQKAIADAEATRAASLKATAAALAQQGQVIKYGTETTPFLAASALSGKSGKYDKAKTQTYTGPGKIRPLKQ